MSGVVHWNPIAGCAIASPGCSLCAAMRAGGPLTIDTGTGPVWTGDVAFDDRTLELPLRLSAPTTIAVCSRSDLFYERIPDEWIDHVFSVINASPQHGYQILTKRPARARAYAEARGGLPPNVALGTSAERQQEADERIPELLAAKATMRFAIFYPLLGPIDLAAILSAAGYVKGAIAFAGIGGEPERPFDPVWARALIADLAGYGIPTGRIQPDANAFLDPMTPFPVPRGASGLSVLAG